MSAPSNFRLFIWLAREAVLLFSYGYILYVYWNGMPSMFLFFYSLSIELVFLLLLYLAYIPNKIRNISHSLRVMFGAVPLLAISMLIATMLASTIDGVSREMHHLVRGFYPFDLYGDAPWWIAGFICLSYSLAVLEYGFDTRMHPVIQSETIKKGIAIWLFTIIGPFLISLFEDDYLIFAAASIPLLRLAFDLIYERFVTHPLPHV